MGLPSACTVLALEACIRFLEGETPCERLALSILNAGCHFGTMSHTSVSEIQGKGCTEAPHDRPQLAPDLEAFETKTRGVAKPSLPSTALKAAAQEWRMYQPMTKKGVLANLRDNLPDGSEGTLDGPEIHLERHQDPTVV